MGPPARGFLTWCLFVAPLLGVLNALSLSNFQPIGGFPPGCTDAYNTPLSACVAAELTHGKPCSKECIKNLDDLTAKIIAACQGTSADNNTLIGAFFVSQGTKTMCPNVVEPVPTAAGQPFGTSVTGTEPSNIATTTLLTQTSHGPPLSTSTTSSSISTAATSTLEPTDSSSISTTTDSTTQPTSTLDSTTQLTSTLTRPTIPLSVLTAVSTTFSPAADSTTSSSKGKATHGGGDGGGGTPFDITSSSNRNVRAIWIPLVSTCVVILCWMV